MISLLIGLLVLCLIIGVVFYIIGLFPIPAPFGNIVRAIVALIFLLILLNYIGVFGGGVHPFVLR